MGLICIHQHNIHEYLPQILEIEAKARYPLGDDFFKIDHGKNYYEFFKRLGALHSYVWQEDRRVVGVASTILRRVPWNQKGKFNLSWYVCDVKIHPDYRGKHITLRMLKGIFIRNYLRCPRGYAVSMNSLGAHQNRIVRLFNNFRWFSIQSVAKIFFWLLDAATMETIHPILERHRGPISFLSLNGIKDLILESTQQPIPLLHVQFGPMAARNSCVELDKAAQYMFCAPCEDSLTNELNSMNIQPSTSATIIAYRMEKNNWQWILTSDI